jgi:hypothetical protein
VVSTQVNMPQTPMPSLQKRSPSRPSRQRAMPGSRHGVHPAAGAQARPITATVHDCDSIRAVLALQVPPLQIGVAQARLCVPAVAQLVASSRWHASKAPHDSAPQATPAVTRVQASVSVRTSGVHAPEEHVGTKTWRERVPLSSQASVNPPQGPQSPRVSGPQLVPLVDRPQPIVSISISTTGEQTPRAHALVVRLRDREPLSLHVAST